MRTIVVICLSILSFAASAQRNKPVITGQKPLSTNENQAITVQMTDLEVTDRDNWFYPFGFTMALQEGEHYTFSGATVTPAPNFHGELKVPVTVNDGKHTSDPFTLIITVIDLNTPPSITGQLPVSTPSNKPVTITFSHLTVTDPDNSYPTGFTIKLSAGGNYTVSGSTVTPAQNFEGTLTVATRVNDGSADSQPFNFKIEVTRGLAITGQKALKVNEDEPLTIEFSQLVVDDRSNTYPTGFTMTIAAGTNYQVTGRTITPAPNFNGLLTANVTISKGAEVSNIYPLQINVMSINDAPSLTELESGALLHMIGNEPVAISDLLVVNDPDDATIILAEIGFTSDSYTLNGDQLSFVNTPEIRGVFDDKEGVLSLIGAATLAQYQQAIRSILYHYSEEVPLDREDRMLYFKLNDGKSVSETYYRAITMGEDIELDIPNAFTPNGDMANDKWEIRALKSSERLSRAIVSIYNSHGQLVFQTTGIQNAWDGNRNGEKLPTDNYYYTIDMGTRDKKNNFKGSIMLLR